MAALHNLSKTVNITYRFRARRSRVVSGEYKYFKEAQFARREDHSEAGGSGYSRGCFHSG
jgi:hypothetical protein